MTKRYVISFYPDSETDNLKKVEVEAKNAQEAVIKFYKMPQYDSIYVESADKKVA